MIQLSELLQQYGAVTIKAVAVKDGMLPSAVMSATYTIAALQVAPLYLDDMTMPVGLGTDNGPTVWLWTDTADSAQDITVYYTLDGSTPSTASPVYDLYGNGFDLTNPGPEPRMVTLKAIAMKPGMLPSRLFSVVLTVLDAPSSPPED